MRALDVLTFGFSENLRAKQWLAFEVGLLSTPQQQYNSRKNNSNNENTVKSIAFWLSIWKKWCLERGIVKAEMKITSRSSLTLCTSDSTPKLKQTWFNLANDDFIPSKVIRTQTEKFLELFCRIFSCFVPYRCENIIKYYCFYLTPLF